MISVEDKISELKQKCSDLKMRLTPQRIEVLKMISSTTSHPDAEMVYREVKKSMSNISLDTVYRTLASLEELGLIFNVDSELSKIRYDADLSPHCHFICVKCGKVIDIFMENSIDAPIESHEIGQVLQTNLQIKGICNDCKE